jgi:arylsulfatase A-like enzyme
LIEGVDYCVGELLKELQQRGLAENTVILFASDNGQFGGEHGFLGKWFMHEDSLRVPMILFDPRAPASQRGQKSGAMTLNLDVAPTLLDLAGLPLASAMQGRSLRPLLPAPNRPFREEFFYEHLYHHGARPPLHIEPSEGVRTRDWAYIRWIDRDGPAGEELYDLRGDPLEMTNLAQEPACKSRLAQMRQLHARFKADLP